MVQFSRRQIVILAAAAAVAMAVYLIVSAATYRIGFPLDDAWIHQTYARNLAIHGEWAFLPGSPSAGSTAPLWSLLLAAGYILRLGPYIWSFFLGWLFLFGLAAGIEWFLRKLNSDWHPLIPWAGCLICLEWHLVWAALSGMETLLSACVVTLVLLSLALQKPNFILLGLVCGLSVWVRPDLITLAAPVGLVFLLHLPRLEKRRWLEFAGMAFGFLLGLVPYLFFNRALSGQIWPNTFYAKQAEYAALQQIPIVVRFLSEIELPLVGVGALLLPGVIAWVWDSFQMRRWSALVGLAWWLGYIGIYAWKLPVTYQHGRYIMPVMPVFFAWGILGIFSLRKAPWLVRFRLVGKAWIVSTAVVALIFWGIVAKVYATDVAIIETEMVNPAQWVADHTDPEATIAAHDIGALGFFGERKIMDMAGLISPEAIPLMRDDQKMASLLDAKKVGYLILTFDWYPGLATRGHLIYRSEGRFAPAQGAENTRIFEWRGSP